MANEIPAPGPERDAWFYRAARKCELDFADIERGGDAEWARNGLNDGLKYGNLKGHERWAYDMLRDIDCDFGG